MSFCVPRSSLEMSSEMYCHLLSFAVVYAMKADPLLSAGRSLDSSVKVFVGGFLSFEPT